MSRISTCFSELRKSHRKALIPFVTAGDPEPSCTVPLLHAMVGAGADMIELGVPFSDPMADGPAIQRSSERALRHGVSLRDVINMVRQFSEDDRKTPVILMGYLNPVEVMGYARFAKAARAAGVDGVLVVDLPPEEADELTHVLIKHHLDPVFLLAPTTNDMRLEAICRAARGFVYYVSLKGVTGSTRLDVVDVKLRLSHIRSKTQLPIGVGFGIKDAESAARIAAFSDAVIVGSALVERMGALAKRPDKIEGEVTTFLKGLRRAIDAA
ncbi:MAG: tryptophan synthase subunit alpha [Gammaproteobacteria bacterium]|nr:tryptophan synthase subunit alpha [Gammaproteobacteria bacterium]MCI0591564.1 tryptophan synthase subunit alpha [Gammaproteobacteria bacterium]